MYVQIKINKNIAQAKYTTCTIEHTETLICLINQAKEKMGRLVEYVLLLVVSTLTGSTNNYYNGKILTTILMDNIPVSIIYTINNKNLLEVKIVVSSVIHYWFILLILSWH